MNSRFGKLLTVVLLAGLPVLFLHSEAPGRPPDKAAGAGEKSVARAPDRALMQLINDAWATLDPDNAAPYYDHSPEAVFYDVSPLKYAGWPAYVRGAREMLATLQSMKYTVGDDAVVHRSGDFAWGTATLHLETVDKGGRRQTMDLRWTPVWEKKDGRWLLVHEHLSAPLPPP